MSCTTKAGTMKLVSQVSRAQPGSLARPPRFPRRRWLRAPGRVGQALLFKVVAFAVTAAIAIWAVSVMAHTMQAMMQSLDH